MLAQLADVHFAYPGTDIFAGVSWQVNPGDRIGLVGPNGCGKSTMLRLLDGRLQPDSGQVARARGITIGYLQQSQEFSGGATILEALLLPFRALLQMRSTLERLEHELGAASGAAAERLLAEYGELQERFTQGGGYTLESRVKVLATDLGFHEGDFSRTVDTLSGGERGRLELAKTLLAEPDLLLLDEPTNHLDVEATEHLEERLREWPKAFVLVSHDRYFLRAVCRDIDEVEGGEIIRFSGGYDRYLEEREARHERMEAAFERQQAHIAKTEDFIRKNIAGQKTKQAQSRRKMLEKVERLSRPQDDMRAAGQIGLRFRVGDHAGGKEALKAEAVTIGYPGAPALLSDFSMTIYRGDRVGFVGPNGCGKSTLLKTLLGQLEPRAGQVIRGHEVRIGYFDQKLSDLDESRSLIDEVRQVRGEWNEDVARNYLARFRFSGDEPYRVVKGLSGGERNRLALAKMMLRPRNLLALDEPTNHLDIPAREVLEEALDDYEGTLLVVSHDRFFLDRIVTRIVHLHEGGYDVHMGNYTDFRTRAAEEKAAKAKAMAAAMAQATASAKATAKATAKAPATATAAPVPPAVDGNKLARAADRETRRAAQREREKKQRRFTELEQKIEAAEAELKEVTERLASEHGGDWQRLHTLVADKEKLESRLRSHLAEWEKLGADLEAMAVGASDE